MRKRLQDLTIKDNFMFAAVMLEKENCKHFLEMTLKIKIADITVNREKTIVYNPEYKGVRLDIEAEDEFHTHYNVEMQAERRETLMRSRYYHSQMDMDMLAAGADYKALPDVYVIFICDYDPFGWKKYQYTISQRCLEAPELKVSDGTHTIFLSTKGENDDEVSEELVRFLKFAGSGLEESNQDFQDDFVRRLQDSVNKIKRDRQMGVNYVYFEELLQEERNAAIAKKEVSVVIKRMQNGIPIAEIAEGLGESEEYITRIYDVISKYAPDYDLDKIVDELTAKNS